MALTTARRAWPTLAVMALCAFGTYFCMYGLRKPFAAATYDGPVLLGLDPKTQFVISQILGYTLSKYLGVKWVSEAPRQRRWPMMVGLVTAAEVALLGFALLPPGAKVVAIFFNGLPLGMIWGLVVRYLEGRRASEFLLTGLSCSFILASGSVKDVGRWLMVDRGVSEYWMPALTGLMFLVPFIVLSALLDRFPDPSERDRLERAARPPLDLDGRRALSSRFFPGLVLLFSVYFVLTAFRDFRDNYGVELFADLGYGEAPGLFTRTELPVALLVLLLMGALGWFRTQRAGLIAVFGVMLFGVVLLGACTLLLRFGLLSGEVWMIGVGLGAYLCYVPFGSFLFDRLMAATQYAGTAVFAINLADAIGYTGSVGLLLFKDLIFPDSSRLQFFMTFCYTLSAMGMVLLTLAGLYFLRNSVASSS
jgi:hypothetical protein